jgi:hypothetical protein
MASAVKMKAEHKKIPERVFLFHSEGSVGSSIHNGIAISVQHPGSLATPGITNCRLLFAFR